MRRNRTLDRLRRPLQGDRKADVVNRLKSARGHLDHVITMLEEDPYVLDVLRQVAAVRGALDATVRTALRHYFEHTFVDAVEAGHTEAAIDELMSALTFLRQVD
ncbi:MAG TPA: metal-sensitive transcriptional regulator [Candidatus Elarobacter sp.]|jgi:DNA-binding FrmR family transcriptional regulator|nr:metal-sensitive transcriptional regulator [Candidatus Elarobacter sp.]